MPDPQQFLDIVLNQSKYHHEHEKFYAQAPFQQAIALHQASRVLMTLADRWRVVEARTPQPGNPYLGCEDLNETATIQHDGVLFLEGGGEPTEITRLKRDLRSIAEDYAETGLWLANAMQASWQVALPLLHVPALGERHRIIMNDWQSAQLQSLISTVIKRALEILDCVDFAPPAIRADLTGPRIFPEYLYAASELIARAADMVSESACLVHDSERRWRVFRQRVQQVLAEFPNGAGASEEARQAPES